MPVSKLALIVTFVIFGGGMLSWWALNMHVVGWAFIITAALMVLEHIAPLTIPTPTFRRTRSPNDSDS